MFKPELSFAQLSLVLEKIVENNRNKKVIKKKTPKDEWGDNTVSKVFGLLEGELKKYNDKNTDKINAKDIVRVVQTILRKIWKVITGFDINSN